MINYDIASKTYDHTRKHSDEVLGRFADRVPFTPAIAVLDFGCGTGNYLNRIQLAFGCRCYGVEPSEGMRVLAAEKSRSLDIRQGDHRKIPFDAEFFDFAFMTDVIHHVPDMVLMFLELWRVLKFGRLLCVVTESHAQIQNRFYNDYFPSLAAKEKQRYPEIQSIIQSAVGSGFVHEETDVLSASAPATITEQFLKNVEEKNYSMFRLLDEREYADGLSRLKRDVGKTFKPIGAGESLIWFKKTAQQTRGAQPSSAIAPEGGSR
ncbi:MAG: class I SAM-dependent methyltransferase [Verrucomicrobiia bacterium]